ncbi:MAG: hypothetical protein LQ338_004718 [Usnochroma carphineum]|nr:MAG: hypothetical protein LQ338_004718 [Usnochroma carphineum]
MPNAGASAQEQPRRTGGDGNNFWAPPNRKNAYHRNETGAKLFRWRGGTMREIPYGQPGLSSYGAATVFGQHPDTDHLLAVDFDAETRDVAEQYGGWKVLSFNHQFLLGPPESYYSFVSLTGQEQLLAAPGSPKWMPELLPKIYDYDSRRQTSNIPKSAGLIGQLPILFALPAFSAPPGKLSDVLTNSMRPNRWEHHGRPHSRDTERGMVVTVYLDPANEHGSTRERLDQLQRGRFGPFYGP